jgi:hypothetical protein
MLHLDDRLGGPGFAFVDGADMRAALEACGSLGDWPMFARSWNDLGADTYRASGDRRRRYGVYAVDADGAIVRQAHQPHYQRPEYNVLFGGVERWFDPIADLVGASASMHTILHFCDRLFRACAPRVASWHVEAHQFRIEARAGAPGQPTPEGVHRDGVDYVLVLLVSRENAASGTTTVYDAASQPLGSFTLSRPFDAALVDDARVAHGVTPIVPRDPARSAYRDVLVVTFTGTNRRI